MGKSWKRRKELIDQAIRRDREVLEKMGIIDQEGKLIKPNRAQKEWRRLWGDLEKN